MKFEVEQKHRVDDLPALERQLAERGVTVGRPIVQIDQYFNHPSRDFARTDEALRIRSMGDSHYVTYKGPKLDATTKTRRELELPLATSSDEFASLLAALGFKPVAIVRKKRRPFLWSREGKQIHGALDDVEGVGTFVELELTAESVDLEAAKSAIASAAAVLGLGPSERRSYLELLLASH